MISFSNNRLHTLCIQLSYPCNLLISSNPKSLKVLYTSGDFRLSPRMDDYTLDDSVHFFGKY